MDRCRPGYHKWKPAEIREQGDGRIFVKLVCLRCAFTTETSTPQGAKP